MQSNCLAPIQNVFSHVQRQHMLICTHSLGSPPHFPSLHLYIFISSLSHSLSISLKHTPLVDSVTFIKIQEEEERERKIHVKKRGGGECWSNDEQERKMARDGEEKRSERGR